jgi:hypothetical protein
MEHKHEYKIDCWAADGMVVFYGKAVLMVCECGKSYKKYNASTEWIKKQKRNINL